MGSAIHRRVIFSRAAERRLSKMRIKIHFFQTNFIAHFLFFIIRSFIIYHKKFKSFKIKFKYYLSNSEYTLNYTVSMYRLSHEGRGDIGFIVQETISYWEL